MCRIFTQAVGFCKCKMKGFEGRVGRKAIGGCSLFVLTLVAGRKTGTRCGLSASIRGLRNLGWGVIDVAGSRLTHVANGICHSDGEDGDLALRLLSLHPVDRGVAALAARSGGGGAYFRQQGRGGDAEAGAGAGDCASGPGAVRAGGGEYAPNAVKKTVVGVGHAAKVQVDHMVGCTCRG
jgi:crossover junction endodeoxyribonuclease RuvC